MNNWIVYIPDGFGGMVEMDLFEGIPEKEAKALAKAKWGKGCILEATI